MHVIDMRRYRDELKILRACPSCRHAIKETILGVIMKIYFTYTLIDKTTYC